MLKHSNTQRGDALIEVLLAVAVMSLVITLAWRTMSLGFDRILVSSERSQTQSLINGQVAMLRAVHDDAQDGNRANWQQVLNNLATAAPSSNGCSAVTNDNKFYFRLNDQVNNWKQPVALSDTYNPTSPIITEGHPFPGQGLWIEARRIQPSNPNARAYYDFYVKACWNHGGQQQLKSVLRLYDV